ncbi:NAD(P)H-dependent flavin oxidoreductase [Lysobacter koreensis]|uniref:Propionate 3-nitronate monooxygenase n=1 Tax=Lysobacter koreensis TaxID=266122 RepID=A0ABW2YSH3_9GAMM
MWNDTELSRRLGLRHPIVQGPFGGGLSSVELLAAVSEAGGLGSFGIHHLAPDAIRALDASIRARTSQPYALNLWVSNADLGGDALTAAQFEAGIARLRPYYDELGLPPPAMPPRYGEAFEAQVEALLEVAPPVFSFVFGIPSAEILEQCRRRGIATIGTVTTVDEALAMDAAGVDAIVATGMEAGGHRVSFLRSAEDSLTGTLALVPQVVDRVRAPVIAAGGIADGRGVAAALMLGARGVQVGTAFLACEESNASAVHRAALFSDQAKYTALTRAFSGRLARGIRNRFVEDMRDGMGVAGLAHGTGFFPYPIQSWFTGSFKPAAVAQGRGDLISLWAGQAALLLRHRHARELFDSLVRDTGVALGQAGRQALE